MKKIISLILVLTLFFSLTGLSKTADAATIRLNKSAIVTGLSETYTLKIVNIPASYKSGTVTWKSSNKKIATVNSKGVVTGISIGKTKVTALVNGKSLSCTVNVRPSTNNYDEAIKNLTIRSYERNKEIYCIIQNDSELDIPLDIELTFYTNGTPVSLKTTKSFVFASNKQLVSFTDADKEYTNYKITYKKGNYIPQNNLSSSVKITTYTENYNYYPDSTDILNKIPVELVNLSIENNSKNLISLIAYIIYFNGSELVAVQNYTDGSIDIGKSTRYNPLVALDISVGLEPSVRYDFPKYDHYELIYSVYKAQ